MLLRSLHTDIWDFHLKIDKRVGFSKNNVQVLIGGKVFTLSGFETEEYLQKVSTYLNHKMAECSNIEGYRRQSAEMRSAMLALNIADDYFKAKRQGTALEQEVEQKDKEMYDLKHELISTQIRCENLEQEIERLKEENQQLQVEVVRLDVEVKKHKR